MNKAELIQAAATKAGATKTQTEAVLNAVLDVIVEAVSSGDKVTLVNFGNFEPKGRKQRQARNPKTQEPMVVPATVVPGFTAGKMFKEATKVLPLAG
jgi:DNA-binding protein HU-beta